MGRITREIRGNIARNIKDCRTRKFPGRGGAKTCAEAFGVSPQQWSPWETGKRTPDELRLTQIAEFFGVAVEYLLHNNSESSAIPAVESAATLIPESSTSCPFQCVSRFEHPSVSSIRSLCWLAETLLGGRSGKEICIKLHPNDTALFLEFWATNRNTSSLVSNEKDLS